jgi:thiol-disulfide isomerase/thioredoxin
MGRGAGGGEVSDDPGRWPDVTGLYVLLAALAAATVFGLVWQRRDGRIRPAGTDPAGTATTGSTDPAGTDPADAPATDATGSTDPAVDPALLSALGVTPGPQVTLLQFSSAFCAPCRTTRVVLADVAGSVDGVRHVEVDAESHLDAVRALGILRTPTTLVLDGEGRIRGRASGAPRKDDVLAALRPLFGTDVPQRGSDEGPPGRV